MSQPAEATASNRLNYMNKKQRAVSSTSSRQVLPATNGNTFTLGSTINLDIAGNQAATFCDFQNSYVKMTLTNTAAAGGQAFKVSSAYALIDKVEILSDGQTISSISNYGAAASIFLDTEVSQETKESYLSLLIGTGVNGGQTFAVDGGAFTYCFPLILTSLFTSNHYIPLMGRSNLRIRITLNDAVRALEATAAVANTAAVLTDVELVTTTIRLSDTAMSLVSAHTGGRFEIISSDLRSAEGMVAANDTTISQNLGFSFSSLDRVFFGLYPTYNTGTANSVANRTKLLLSEYAISINGQEYPQRRIKSSVSNNAESIAEMAIASSSLANFQHQTALTPDRWVLGGNTGVGVTDVLTGQFTGFIDTESMKPHSNEDAIYSGISSLGATTQLVANMSGATNLQCTLIVFAQYTQSMTLDLNGTGTWVVAV